MSRYMWTYYESEEDEKNDYDCCRTSRDLVTPEDYYDPDNYYDLDRYYDSDNWWP